MRLAYLDGSAGVSGDMLLGALIHAGAPVPALRVALRSLALHAELDVEPVDRSGIAATHARILSHGRPADETPHHHHHHHHHEPHRSLADIRKIIAAADLPSPVVDRAIRAFTLLGEAEAKVHGIPLEKVHFHEVGAVDAIADIVLVSVAASVLNITAWRSSPLNVGSGTVQCAHGRFPVPAPATAELLRGLPTYSSGHEGELVTPTGAALLRAFETTFGAQPALVIDAIGYGAGTRNPPDLANVARLVVGETDSADAGKTVVVIETALDDCSPQVVAHFAEEALRLGALDVLRTPVFMKKNRTGTLLTVLADREHAPAIEQLLLRETSTLGFRRREEQRVCLERRFVEVATEWGPVRIKVGLRGGAELNAAPEFEDCRRVAESHAVPLKQVMEAALRAYRGARP